jgi:hypothetical protein
MSKLERAYRGEAELKANRLRAAADRYRPTIICLVSVSSSTSSSNRVVDGYKKVQCIGLVQLVCKICLLYIPGDLLRFITQQRRTTNIPPWTKRHWESCLQAPSRIIIRKLPLQKCMLFCQTYSCQAGGVQDHHFETTTRQTPVST